MRTYYGHFQQVMRALRRDVQGGDKVNTGQWQSKSDTPLVETIELQFVAITTFIADNKADWVTATKPNLPWAEDHFQERVSGIPHNPPPSAAHWPFAQAGHADHTDDRGLFSHTYPERLWGGGAEHLDRPGKFTNPGDLDDLVNLMVAEPHTRQAFIPIWWPSDGAYAGRERVPCTLGYHFLLRDGCLDCLYPMRSCDLMRHFADDVYMAGRLVQWLCEQLDARSVRATPGELNMIISSLHVFRGDLQILAYEERKGALI